jgi:hypothetical protein
MMVLAHVGAAATGGASGTTVAWFTLAGALGGVLLTGLISLVSATLNHRWQAQGSERQRLQDHNTLIRQERRQSYVAYWLAWNRFVNELRTLSDLVPEIPSAAIANRHLNQEQLKMNNAGELARRAQVVIDKVSETELEWQAAADALLLIADPGVENAANAHIAMTEQKLSAAWEGQSHHDENGATYHALNNAMRAALLTAVQPEAWDIHPARTRRRFRL